MCGFAGLLLSSRKSSSFDELGAVARTMAHSINHRGPDQNGFWIDENAGIALSHTRLSIVDISTAGIQPMKSRCSRYIMVYNGEVYNQQELRKELENLRMSQQWNGHSDTEVLLDGIAYWGVEGALKRTRGMFVLAIWDRLTKVLTLARDRIGQKPLYYGHVNGDFVFGSELKAFHAVQPSSFDTDRIALELMLRHGYVPGPRTIYRGIRKLQPGTLLRVNANGSHENPISWWELEDEVKLGLSASEKLNDVDAINQLDVLLRAAVSEQMIADVPIGSFLSGGIDSTIITSIMQSKSPRPINTYTVRFAEKGYNEAAQASLIAKYIGSDHTELFLGPQQALEVIPRLPDIYDEPFGDSSQIPTALVCALASKNVSVCLSGDAGDELFGGYNRYYWVPILWRNINRIPHRLRWIVQEGVNKVPHNVLNTLSDRHSQIIPKKLRAINAGDKLQKVGRLIAASSIDELYITLVSQWIGESAMKVEIENGLFFNSQIQKADFLQSWTEKMMYIDTVTYLPDDILVKLDRAAMAASLETRVPFLDERIISFAWQLPLNQRVRQGKGKWLLRQLLYRYVPKELVDKPKQGFGVPIDDWLRGPLREWAESLLSHSALSADGMLDPAPIRSLWQLHLSGRNVHHALWNILMYQAWKLKWC